MVVLLTAKNELEKYYSTQNEFSTNQSSQWLTKFYKKVEEKNACTSSGKTKLAMVAIFFRKKTSIRKAHFQFSFMPAAKKWQITPILLFRFRSGIFYWIFYAFTLLKNPRGAVDFRIFRRSLAPIATERPEWSGAEWGLAVKAGRALVEFAVVTFYCVMC